MKCLINLNNLNLAHLLYISIRLCIVNLLIIDNVVFTFKSSPSPPIVRHPGTCTYSAFQQSQEACTFSLLCYLAGGVPVEGCGTGRTISTCCILQHTPTVQKVLDYSKLLSANNENIKNSDHKSNDFIHQQQQDANNRALPSSIIYSDQSSTVDKKQQPLATFSPENNPLEQDNLNSPSTESSLMPKNNDDLNALHSSSSLSTSSNSNPYDSISNNHQTHHIHHSARSLYPSIAPPISHPSSLQYHHRLQHTYSSTATNPHHLDHQKQHQHNLYLHNQRLASHPPFSHHNSLYHSSIYHHPHQSYNSRYHSPQASSNARSFQLSRYNDQLFSQYQSNYLLNDNLNYYGSGDDSTTYPTEPPLLPPSPSYGENLNSYSYNVNSDQTPTNNPYSQPSVGDLSSPSSHSIAPPSAYNNPTSGLQPNEPDSNSYLNDYSNPSPNVPNPPSSLLSDYSPTQTIDFKTYQKHSVNPNTHSYIPLPQTPSQTDHHHLQFPSLYSTSSSISSFESTTNHTMNHQSLNSNKMYEAKPPPHIDHYSTAAVESPASIKYYNSNMGKDYESSPPQPLPPQSTSYNNHLPNNQPEDNPTLINSEEENRLLLDNSRLTTDEDDYNSNAIRRSRLASSSPLNSITIERQTQARNFIGEDICGQPVSSKPLARIIGGSDAHAGEYPWMVHIKVGAHQCGGALISREYIATAAHCVYNANHEKLTLILGAHDIELKNSKFYEDIPQHHLIESVLLHPNFRFSAAHPDRFDIALLKLKRPALYTNSVRPICLPPPGLQLEGWRAVVTGWGKTDSHLANRFGTRLLQKVDVPIIKNQECEKWHQTRGIDIKIFSEMMCAGYENGEKDACVGDSGGPLIIYLNNRWTLAGITSAGFGCAQSKQPGIYHRVSHTVDWILQQLANT